MQNVKTKQTETEKLFADLNKPSLVGLSYALRHPELWPPGFQWNYKSCETCAMGLAHQLWNDIPLGSNNANQGASIMAKAFAIPFSTAKNVFMGQTGSYASSWVPSKIKREWLFHKKNVCDQDAITPEMVADQIDKYLETVE